MIRTQTFVFFLLLHMSLFGQKAGINPKTTLGINLPILVDNTYEFSLRQQFKNKLRADFSVGWSENTNDLFNNGRNNFNSTQVSTPQKSVSYNYQSQSISGNYYKLAINLLVPIPEVIYNGKFNRNYFYIGPLIGLSNYQQTGTATTITTEIEQIEGKPATNTSTSVQEDVSELGKIFGKGFSFGFSFLEQNKVSIDIGMDVLGFKRNSKLYTRAHTIGLGNHMLLRLNYKISK